MRATQLSAARHASVDAIAALAGETRHAVGRVVATGLFAKASADDLIAFLRRVPAVVLGFAGAAACDEAAGEVLTSGGEADLSERTRVLIVA